ncbi:threonine/homoserine/homoserine lactone efflux protein [Nonomuraea thailandensis]|uniref:Threonine/homoserine/homoserine lactone efflux protein n=1 Tax=Nonomuraea thailandensis TaxID=1188745 RepID=A0A9X2K8S6_9ACTN|nr:LysE family translocator [Nonomuraea thailandensis]MCP2361106.1 threonine/homoserine/homoserine lactone efflux protein [Nonomuraea thailandensis]
MDTELLLLFLGMDLLLICTPGPDMLYVLARSLGQGRRTGLTAVAGICCGYAVHTALAAAGLATALRAVPAALPVMRYAGAAYLVFLAVRTLMSLRSREPRPLGAPAAEPRRRVLRQSALTALLNPKGLLLYLSLMPQFISTGTGVPLGLQLTALGLLHVVNCALLYGLVAVATARASTTLTGTPKAARRISAVSGTLLLVVAAATLGAH